MKNKYIIIGFVLSCIIFVWYFYPFNKTVDTVVEETNKVSTSTGQNVVATSSTSKTVKPTTTKSTKTTVNTSLLSVKGSFECKLEMYTAGQANSSTMYLSGNKMRVELRPANTAASISVYDGTYLYTWTEGKAVGTRTQPKTKSELPAVIPTDFSGGQTIGSGISNASWSCHPWSIVGSMLAKPTYVKFN